MYGTHRLTLLTYLFAYSVFYRPDALPVAQAINYSVKASKVKWWGASVVVCLERGVDLHMVQLMPLPLTVSYFSKIQTCFTFLVPAHPGGPGQRAVKRARVCM